MSCSKKYCVTPDTQGKILVSYIPSYFFFMPKNSNFS